MLVLPTLFCVLVARPDLGVARLHSVKTLAMSLALALMHSSDYSRLLHSSEYSELMQALQCMQERKQLDCCRKCYIPEAEDK